MAAYGQSIPFPDGSFDIVLSDNVIDHAEHPAKILAEMARVPVPEGALYLEVNISHPLYGLFSRFHGLWSAMGMPLRVDDFAIIHPTFHWRARAAV